MRDMTFFKGLLQASVSVGDFVYCVPTFYYDAAAVMVTFMTPLQQIRALLPSPRLHPLRVTPWHGLTTIGAIEYRDCDPGPYNEIAIAFPITLDRPAPILTGMLQQMAEGPFLYFKELPVTTEIARVGGVEFFGFPKSLATIEFERKDGWIHCRLAEGDNHILTLSARQLPVRPGGRTRYHGITICGERLLRCEGISNARSLGASRHAGDVRLELGHHHMAEELRTLRLGRLIDYQYLPENQLILTSALESYAAQSS